MFLYRKSGLKVKRRRKKRVKSREKNFKKNFCLAASTWRDEISLIKVAYLMLNFLNLKSFLRHLFFWVASCLSTLCVIPWVVIIDLLLLKYIVEKHLIHKTSSNGPKLCNERIL